MGTNSGSAGKQYGHARTKRGRFNANPTMCSHPSCTVSARAKNDKKFAEKAPRVIKIYTSKAKGIFSV